MEVYEQDENLANYAYATGLPSMSELTFCMWLKSVGDSYKDEHLFSLAASSGRYNIFLLLQSGRIQI